VPDWKLRCLSMVISLRKKTVTLNVPSFAARSSLLLIAPHPTMESLACSSVIPKNKCSCVDSLVLRRLAP
jgi:hypothetical protein